MKILRHAALALFLVPVGCGSSTPEPETAPPPPASTPAPVASAPPPEPTPPPPPEPTAEEKAKAAAAKALADDRATWEAEAKAEDARWTADLHGEAKALASAKYASTKVGVTAILKGHHRQPGHADRDKYRHPVETLEFWGVTPTSNVLEIGPGEGWYTEILAPLLATKGHLSVTASNPDGPADQRSTFYGQRLKKFLDRSPELYGKVDRILFDSKAPDLKQEGKLDVIIVARAMHGLHRDKLLNGFLAEMYKGLKVGGVLAIEQHRAKDDANPDEVSKNGYLPQKWLIEQIEAAGFKLAGKPSEVNANPKDTKDYAEGVWTLPPSLALKDKDKQKYVDIGESDRMTLKFVKQKAPKAAAAATSAPPPPAPKKKKLDNREQRRPAGGESCWPVSFCLR